MFIILMKLNQRNNFLWLMTVGSQKSEVQHNDTSVFGLRTSVPTAGQFRPHSFIFPYFYKKSPEHNPFSLLKSIVMKLLCIPIMCLFLATAQISAQAFQGEFIESDGSAGPGDHHFFIHLIPAFVTVGS